MQVPSRRRTAAAPTLLPGGLTSSGTIGDATAFRDALLSKAAAAAIDPTASPTGIVDVWRAAFPDLRFYLPEGAESTPREVTFVGPTAPGGASAANPWVMYVAVTDDAGHCVGGTLSGFPRLITAKPIATVPAPCDAASTVKAVKGA